MNVKLLIITLLTGLTTLFPKSFVSSKSSEAKVIKPLNDNNLPYFELEPVPNVATQEHLAKAGLLFDAKQRKITWEKDMFTAYPIASLTKMMVALITVEDIKANKLSWETPIKVTKEASRIGGSKVYLKYGEIFTIRELMKSAMIASGNDACYLLAQFNGGTESQFVERMNQRAKLLGMKTARFSNCTGLPMANLQDNMASPYDMLLLANELLKHKEVVDIARLEEESIQHGRRKFSYRNHNKLVIEYKDEVDGLKTGYTVRAGFCIVATSNRAGHRLISVVLGAHKSVTRNMLVAEMFNNYYSVVGLGRMGVQLTSN